MANLEALPSELLARIISFSDRNSLAQFRLTSKRLEEIAVAKLFERVTLYAHWAKESDDEEEEKADCDHNHGIDTEDTEEVNRRDTFKRNDQAVEQDEAGDFTAGSDLEQDQRNVVERSNRAMQQDEEDGFVAGSDIDEDDLPETGMDGDLELRPRIRDEGSRQEQSTDEIDLFAEKTNQLSPHPDPFSGRLDDFQLYEEQCRQKWEASRPQWAREDFPGPSDYDATVFRNIMENDRLKKYAKEVQVYTCETHCVSRNITLQDHHPRTRADLYRESWPRPNFHPVYKECVERLAEFPNDDEVFQDADFQHKWLEHIVQSTNNNISNIAVRHYENPQDEEGAETHTPHFLHKVATASSLRLSVKHEEMHPGSGTTYRDGRIHPFWKTFPAQLLQPASDTLTTLVLYSDLPLGWFPKLDLRAVHLPKLSSLTLGHHVLHHDHQVNWIISHRDTLRELILDRCSVLYQIGCSIHNWLDDDGYPRNVDQFGEYGYSADPNDEDPAEFERELLLKSNDVRWHTVFSRFASSLLNLREFRFGSSTEWDFNTTTRHFRAGAVTHMPIIPWEDEHNIKSGLFEERYVIWDDWQNEYRSKWFEKDSRGRNKFGDGWQDEWLARLEDYPWCGKEDGDALQALLQAVEGR
ncbi:uncharacterized protein N0V89_005616 [Didymosphaeria variabile]|uniref:F-box domain-containing protein n=1 Tax=Didymosphaeria variabile TaxID=1932322 RepID=A0A9W9CAM7_9PLEO|nr:uncharacterized protein N0V89_005616 [Didymosphaeria variabile]KAJ4353886.1 hypothetical protein N0V89_005616 [Didymosphaeria variabile]